MNRKQSIFAIPVPPITTSLFLATLAIFVALQLPFLQEWVASLVWPMPYSWGSALFWYSQFARSLVHVDFFHWAMNATFLIILGRAIEFRVHVIEFVVLIILCSFISNGFQTAIYGENSIGISGLVYAMLGYMKVLSPVNYTFSSTLKPAFLASNNRLGLFELSVIWLFVCYALTYFQILNIANLAHTFGLISGIVLGAMSRRDRPLYRYLGTASLFILILALIYLVYGS